jgi:hypothetical protein
MDRDVIRGRQDEQGFASTAQIRIRSNILDHTVQIVIQESAGSSSPSRVGRELADHRDIRTREYVKWGRWERGIACAMLAGKPGAHEGRG